MKRVRLTDLSPTADDSAMFIGHVTRASVVTDDNPDLLRVAHVTFHDGARNRRHRHGSDQLLIVTTGVGFVATDDERIEVQPGDVVHVPAGEPHWHGAVEGATMSHLSILTPGDLVIEE